MTIPKSFSGFIILQQGKRWHEQCKRTGMALQDTALLSPALGDAVSARLCTAPGSCPLFWCCSSSASSCPYITFATTWTHLFASQQWAPPASLPATPSCQAADLYSTASLLPFPAAASFPILGHSPGHCFFPSLPYKGAQSGDLWDPHAGRKPSFGGAEAHRSHRGLMGLWGGTGPDLPTLRSCGINSAHGCFKCSVGK